MKKLLFCILLIAFQCSVLFAQSDAAIYIDMTKPDGTNNRLTVKLTNTDSSCILEAAVSSPESYTIVIQGQTNDVVYDCELITDGNNHTYMFPGLPQGVYTLWMHTPSDDTAVQFLIR